MICEENVCLVDDTADKEVDLLFVSVSERLEQVRAELLDAVVCSLNDIVDAVVNVADCRRGGVQKIDIDDGGEGLVSANETVQLSHHLHHRVGFDAAVDLHGVEVAAPDARPKAASQQRLDEHLGQHRSRHCGIVRYLMARWWTVVCRYIGRVLCNRFITNYITTKPICDEAISINKSIIAIQTNN